MRGHKTRIKSADLQKCFGCHFDLMRMILYEIIGIC